MVVIELESKSSSQTNGFVVFVEEESKVNDNVEIGQDDQKDGNIEQNDGSVNDVKGDDDKEDDDNEVKQ